MLFFLGRSTTSDCVHPCYRGDILQGLAEIWWTGFGKRQTLEGHKFFFSSKLSPLSANQWKVWVTAKPHNLIIIQMHATITIHGDEEKLFYKQWGTKERYPHCNGGFQCCAGNEPIQLTALGLVKNEQGIRLLTGWPGQLLAFSQGEMAHHLAFSWWVIPRPDWLHLIAEAPPVKHQPGKNKGISGSRY